MLVSIWLSFREGVAAAGIGDDGVAVEGRGVRLSFRPDHPAIADALLSLAPPGCRDDRVADVILDAAGPEALAVWYHAVDRLDRRGLLARTVRSPSGPVLSLTPISDAPATTGAGGHLPRGRRYRLSRFAYLRRRRDALVLESPDSPARAVLHDPAAAAMIAGLAVPSSPDELAGRAAGLPVEVVIPILGLLVDAGMIETVDDAEPVTSSRDAWEFHDRLFHARSRRGRTDAPFGGTFRLAGRMECPPSVRPVPEGEPLPLFRPDLARLGAEDPPLTRVVESRRSIRAYGRPPIDARQVGEWLYRVARVRDEHELDLHSPSGAIRIATAARPYPSGGALYELEFYPVVADGNGIDAGLHYYEPSGHSLIKLSGRTPEVEGLLREAAESAGIARESLQVLVIVTARVPRIAWKYESMAYALVLKHVGVVYHAMYLAATAMGLAPCALGTGDSVLFARAAGLDEDAETAVGEFLLGARPAADPAPC